MSDPRPQELPADWLDHIVLDMAELETLAERISRSLGAIRPTEAPKGALSVQLMDHRGGERRDPTEPWMAFEIIDLSLGEHAAIAHQDDALETKAGLQLDHLIGHRGLILAVAGIDIDRDRHAVVTT